MPEFCSNCNAQVPDGSKVCPECGVEFEGEVEGKLQTMCERCGSEVSENAAFCANCGAVFNQYGTLTRKNESARPKGRVPGIVLGAALSYMIYGGVLVIVSIGMIVSDLIVLQDNAHLFFWGLGILIGGILLVPSILYLLCGLIILKNNFASKIGAVLGIIVSLAYMFLTILTIHGIQSDAPLEQNWPYIGVVLPNLPILLTLASWSHLGKRV